VRNEAKIDGTRSLPDAELEVVHGGMTAQSTAKPIEIVIGPVVISIGPGGIAIHPSH